jgi:hypothetical protein
VGAEIQQLLVIVLTDPIADESVRRKEVELAIGLSGLQGQYPSVELRGIEIALKQGNTFLPHIHFGLTPLLRKATPRCSPELLGCPSVCDESG